MAITALHYELGRMCLWCTFSCLFGELIQVSLVPCFGQPSASRPLVVQTAFIQMFEDSSVINSLTWSFKELCLLLSELSKCEFSGYMPQFSFCPTLHHLCICGVQN